MKFATALLLAVTMAGVNGLTGATTTTTPQIAPVPMGAATSRKHEHRCIQDTDTVQGMIEASTVISDAFRQWGDELLAPNSTFADLASSTAGEGGAEGRVVGSRGFAVGEPHPSPDSAQTGRAAAKRLHTLNRTELDAMAQLHNWTQRVELRRRQLNEQRRVAAAQTDETGPIRFSISTIDLSTSGQYCASSGASVPDMQGSTTTCTSDDVLTTAKRTFLTDVLLPRATQILATHLQVTQRTTNLVVASTVVCGSQFSVPSTDVSTGIADADYRLYIAAVPAGSGVLAWAAGCQLASDNRRFIVGRANFAPAYLEPDGDVDAQVVTAVHELTHALGFTYGRFTALGMTTSISIRSKTTNAIDSSLVIAQAENFYNCDSITGVELEDEGGSGSANSHWEKRTAPEEIMTATSGERYSPLTLAAMETIGYTANYSSAWPMIIGRNKGCEFLDDLCNTAGGGKDTAFCFTSGATGCTADYIGYGTCVVNQYTSSLPTYFQYFTNPTYGGPTFYDGCPMIFSYSNRRCINAAEVPTSSEQVIGLYFGSDSRCFSTSGLIKSGYTGAEATGTCLKSRCVDGVVQFAVGDSSWLTCGADGQVLSGISGFSGSVTCPAASDFCLSFGVSGSTGLLPLPVTRAPIASGTNEAPTDTKYTCKGTLIISGGGWGNVIRNAPDLLNEALTMDIADVLSVELQQVLLISTTVGSLVAVYVANGPTATMANSAFSTMINSGGRDGIGRTLYVYANHSDDTQDSPTTISHNAVGQNENICTNTWSSLDTDAKCYGVIAAIAVAAFLIIVCIAVCITRRCCNRSKEDQTRQMSNIGYGTNNVVPVAGGNNNGGGRSGAHAVFPYQGTVRAAAAQQATGGYNYGGAPSAQMHYYGNQGVPVSAYPLSYGSGSFEQAGGVPQGSGARSGTPGVAGKKSSNSPTGYVEGGHPAMPPPPPGRPRRGTY